MHDGYLAGGHAMEAAQISLSLGCLPGTAKDDSVQRHDRLIIRLALTKLLCDYSMKAGWDPVG